jgi:hypothetical protein
MVLESHLRYFPCETNPLLVVSEAFFPKYRNDEPVAFRAGDCYKGAFVLIMASRCPTSIPGCKSPSHRLLRLGGLLDETNLCRLAILRSDRLGYKWWGNKFGGANNPRFFFINVSSTTARLFSVPMRRTEEQKNWAQLHRGFHRADKESFLRFDSRW